MNDPRNNPSRVDELMAALKIPSTPGVDNRRVVELALHTSDQVQQLISDHMDRNALVLSNEEVICYLGAAVSFSKTALEGVEKELRLQLLLAAMRGRGDKQESDQ